MKIGLQVPSFTWPGGAAAIGPKLAEIARTAEEQGFHSLWLMDHYFQIMMVGPPELDMLEGYSGLSFCAAVTKRLKLGTMATGVTYRYPGVLVKTATTLDVLSQGRAYLGIGAAWFEQEHRGLGVPFPPLGVRFEMLEETLQIAKQMWAGGAEAYNGEHFTLEEAMCRPLPVTRPHPPILVAGGGETKTLRLVAQYADACNLFGEAPAVRQKLDVLKRHCDTLGRNYADIEKTTLNTVKLASGEDTASDVIARCRALADEGVQQALFNMPGVEDLKPLEVFGREIIPAVAGF
jgi:F420-dependent oxidoreductase-like protein